jgi:tetratricopeptide (TPR) repeat protein
MVQVKLQRAGEAAETFRKVIALEPNSAEAHLNLGITLTSTWDFEGAVKDFTEAVRLAPRLAATHYNRGRTLYILHRYEEAKVELETACHVDPRQASALYFLALIERRRNDGERCAKLAQRVVALEPKNTDALSLEGQCVSRIGKEEEAIALWKRAVEIDPQYAPALYRLSKALEKSDPQKAHMYEARFTVSEKCQKSIDQAETLNNMALKLASADDWFEAIEQLSHALQICQACPEQEDLHRNLGLVYSRSGDLQNGARELRVALQLKPDDADALKALKIIEGLQKPK